MSELKAYISAIASYLPEKILSNQDLEKMVETNDEWIFSRTGIRERRIASSDEHASTMGIKASQKVLQKVSITPEDIDLIITATMTPDYSSSSTAALIQHAIGAKNAAAMDLQAACTGFLYGLSTAQAYVASGMYRTVLLVATEKMSSVVNYEDRASCILFGDGAAALIISNQPGILSIGPSYLRADGSLAELINIPAGGSRLPASKETVESGKHFLTLRGSEVFKNAVRSMSLAAIECLKKEDLTIDDVNWLIPHQANVRIIDAISKQFGFDYQKVVKTLDKYGNTSASSVGIALDELLQKGQVLTGDHLLLIAFGAGLTSGAMLLKKIDCNG